MAHCLASRLVDQEVKGSTFIAAALQLPREAWRSEQLTDGKSKLFKAIESKRRSYGYRK